MNIRQYQFTRETAKFSKTCIIQHDRHSRLAQVQIGMEVGGNA